MRALIVLVLTARIAAADCPTGQTPASCALHEEAVTLFTAGKYDDAATKFRAAIAAGPTARSYLGYSQAVEGQGKIALAYETMLVAKKLSDEEVATNGSDTAVQGRAERIKYKLAELGAKIAYVWLRLPDGVAPQRIVSVYREGEGDLAQPLGRWIVVAPEKQNMFATLDDGRRVAFVATVAPGSQGTVVIPIAVQAPPVIIQQPFQQPQPTEPEPEPTKPAPNPANSILALDVAFVVRDADRVGKGLGFATSYERKLQARVALTARLAIVFHPSTEEMTGLTETTSTSATEGLVLLGARTRSKLPLYAGAEIGALWISRRTTIQFTGSADRVSDASQTNLAVLLGGGIRLGKVHLEIGALLATPNGDIDLPARFFATLGVDLIKR